MDDFNELLEKNSPSILEDQFSELCYYVFTQSEQGKVLMAHLYEQYVYMPFTDITQKNPDLNMNQIFAKAVKRDFVQQLLSIAQNYEHELYKKGTQKHEHGSHTIKPN